MRDSCTLLCPRYAGCPPQLGSDQEAISVGLGGEPHPSASTSCLSLPFCSVRQLHLAASLTSQGREKRGLGAWLPCCSPHLEVWLQGACPFSSRRLASSTRGPPAGPATAREGLAGFGWGQALWLPTLLGPGPQPGPHWPRAASAQDPSLCMMCARVRLCVPVYGHTRVTGPCQSPWVSTCVYAYVFPSLHRWC